MTYVDVNEVRRAIDCAVHVWAYSPLHANGLSVGIGPFTAASLFVRRVRVLPYNNIAAKEHDADPKAEARRAELKEVQDEVCRAERSAEPKCTAKMQSRFQQSSKRVGG